MTEDRKTGARILDHVRLCGSLDVYLAIDAWGWYLIEGVELEERDALARLTTPPYVVIGHHETEAEARKAFEERRG